MRVELWTDGSGRGVDPTIAGVPGAWAYVLVAVDDHGKVIRRRDAVGGALRTSSNRMELAGVLEGLRAVRPGTSLTVFSDSQYVIRAFTDGWLEGWKARGWHKVKNADIWRAVDEEVARLDVTFEWVPGHAGIKLNELAHTSADSARRKLLEAIELTDDTASIDCGFPVVDGAPEARPVQESLMGLAR